MKKVGGRSAVKGLGFLMASFVLVFLALRPIKVLGAAASISGTTTHATDGTPIETLFMYAENDATGDTDYTVTDANGDYTIAIDDDGSGTAGVYTVYNLYYSATETDVFFIKQTQSVTLVDGEDKADIDFVVDQQGKLNGYVYEKDGTTPIDNAYIWAVRTNSAITLSDSDYATATGYYTVSPYSYSYFEEANDGTYTINVTAQGYFGTTQTGIQITKNTSSSLNLTLTKASTVSGTLTNNDNEPISGAVVSLQEIDSDIYDINSYTAESDANGDYTIEVYDLTDYDGTAVGNYTLEVTNAAGYIGKSKPLTITADESVSTENDFSLEQAGTITGKIYQANGSTIITGATISADDGYGNTYTATSADDGGYTLDTLRASSNYTLTISKSGYVTQKAYQISLAAGETTDQQNFNLVGAVTFAGKVLTKNNANIEGATVALYNRAKPRSSYPDYSGTTYSSGAFEITDIQPGNYRIKITKSGYITAQYKKVKITKDVAGKNYKLATALQIFGRITNKKQAVSNALVTIYSKQDSSVGYGYAYTDSQGYYNITNIKAGKYVIKVDSAQYVQKILTKKITSKTKNINVTIGTAGSVSGFITDKETGLPVSGYAVRVKNQANLAYTDANGYYIMDSLAPGKYQFYVASTAYKTAWRKKIKIKSDQETEDVNFSLKPIE